MFSYQVCPDNQTLVILVCISLQSGPVFRPQNNEFLTQELLSVVTAKICTAEYWPLKSLVKSFNHMTG